MNLVRGQGAPGRGACWMSAINYYQTGGKEWNARPAGVSPLIQGMAIWLNDTAADGLREKLIGPHLFDPVGTDNGCDDARIELFWRMVPDEWSIYRDDYSGASCVHHTLAWVRGRARYYAENDEPVLTLVRDIIVAMCRVGERKEMPHAKTKEETVVEACVEPPDSDFHGLISTPYTIPHFTYTPPTHPYWHWKPGKKVGTTWPPF